MNNYFNAVSNSMKNWKVSVPVIIFTIARIVYGWSWFQAGLHKLEWLSDGKLNAAGKIQALITNIAVGTAEKPVTHFDPLYINKIFAWVADNIFLSMPALTDFLVVIGEMAIGLVFILGFQIFWGAIAGLFFNTQFMAGGSFNNFGYIWTNVAVMQWSKYFGAIGVDGFLRVKKGKELV